MSGTECATRRRPEIVPLGDCALLVRFGTGLEDGANLAALAFADRLAQAAVTGVREIVPSLVSVLVRYDADAIGTTRLAGECALLMGPGATPAQHQIHDIAVHFDGPDLAEVARTLGLTPQRFIERHNEAPLRVLTTGFAPGFVYCGLHGTDLLVPRRQQVRARVVPGCLLFAAGQTAIVATEVPTGWHVIGQTDFRNFRPDLDPPTVLRAGDRVRFGVAP